MTAPSLAPVAIELLTEAECVRRVPGRDSEVREWLRSLAGVRRRGPTGIVLYVWPEVVVRMPLLDEPGGDDASPPPRGPTPSRRATLVPRP